MISANKEIVKGFFFYITFSVLGPLFFVGGVGYFLDRLFETNFLVYIFILIAYVFSNIAMFRKLKEINSEVDKIGNQGKRKTDKEGQKSKNKER